MKMRSKNVSAAAVAIVATVSVLCTAAVVARAQAPVGAVEVVTMLAFTEGPAQAPDGTLYFTDLPSQRIVRIGRDGKQSTYRENSNLANGLTFDREGRLIACEGGVFARPGLDFRRIDGIRRGGLTEGPLSDPEPPRSARFARQAHDSLRQQSDYFGLLLADGPAEGRQRHIKRSTAVVHR